MGQLVSYPSYNSGSLYLQFPWIKLYTYGIPRLGEYYKTDDDRSHLRLPLDLSIPEIADFVNKIKAIDAKFSSDSCELKGYICNGCQDMKSFFGPPPPMVTVLFAIEVQYKHPSLCNCPIVSPRTFHFPLH